MTIIQWENIVNSQRKDENLYLSYLKNFKQRDVTNNIFQKENENIVSPHYSTKQFERIRRNSNKIFVNDAIQCYPSNKTKLCMFTKLIDSKTTLPLYTFSFYFPVKFVRAELRCFLPRPSYTIYLEILLAHPYEQRIFPSKEKRFSLLQNEYRAYKPFLRII